MQQQINLFYFLLLLFVPIGELCSQTIEIQLPFYAGKNYFFCLQQGTKQDTIVSGTLNSQGQTTIVLSDKDKPFRGMGRFYIKGRDKAWNIIIGGEGRIAMNGLSGKNETKVVFEGSKENNFVNEISSIQKQFFEKQGFIRAGLNFYQKQDPFYPDLEKEYERLESNYNTLRTGISNNPLYAARLVEILNCLSDIGSSMTMTAGALHTEQREFITHKLDFEDLYTSGLWLQIFDLWSKTTSSIDSLMENDCRYMLSRTNNIVIRRELTQTFVRIFSRYGKDHLLPSLGNEFLKIPLIGQIAPEIKVDNTSFLPKNCLILFYETDCGNCSSELDDLKRRYQIIVDKHIRVISIAADLNKASYEKAADTFPWIDKLCDFNGFDGDNFKNYGIIGTPTYIFTDEQGVISGRYAQLKELF